MAADKAQAGCVEQHSDSNCSLVSGRTAHPRLHSVNSNIPSKQRILNQRLEIPTASSSNAHYIIIWLSIIGYFENKSMKQQSSDSWQTQFKARTMSTRLWMNKQLGRKWPSERAGLTDLMKGACCGLMKTNKHTPTSCSDASSTYLLSLEIVFWSSTAQSFWFVVLQEHIKGETSNRL